MILDLDVTVSRPGFRLAVRQALPLDGVTAVFGPSGAGKSTLLRAIAGFERTAGRIALDGDVLQDARRFVPPHRRRVATVFQDARLFPHLTVAGNLAYAARRSGMMAEVEAVAARIGLTALLPRAAAGLSGGETQRAAIARALLSAPRLILMDEPLSALDAAGRAEILPVIESLAAAGDVPVIYVSHAVGEVARLARQVLLIAGGQVAGYGPADEMLAGRAGFADASYAGSLIAATVRGPAGDGLTAADFAGGTILTPEALGPPGTRVRFLVRSRDVLLSLARPEGLSALNILPATVTAATPDGASVDLDLSLAGTPLRARITARSARLLGLAPGTACHAILKSVAVSRD